VIPNQKLLTVASERTPLLETFRKADQVLLHAVKGISDLINIRGLINLDFADIRTVMQAKGMAIMGSGWANGDNRAVEAATQAISSPLLENICIDGATGIIINVTGGPDLTLWEVNEASTLITEAAHPDAEIIFGAVIDENMADAVSVTVIATGFGTNAMKTNSDQINKLHAATHTATEAQLMSAGMQRLQQDMGAQSYENVNLSHEVSQPEMPMSMPPPVVQERAQPSMPLHQPQPQAQQTAPQPHFPMNPPPQAPRGDKSLPREALLAKARAYRESQANRGQQDQGEQLSMNMEEGAPQRLTPEPARSPFESDSLEVPSYLRRKRGPNLDQPDGLE
jgi:cell division protein FtsZ